MPRTFTTFERLAIAGSMVWHYNRLEVQDADGNWKDLTAILGDDFYISGEVSEERDAPAASATFMVQRKRSNSVVPLITGSLANRNSVPAYAPLLDLGRLVRFSAAVGRRNEVPGTNLLRWANRPDNAVYTRVALNYVLNAATAPDGTATAVKVQRNATTDIHYTYQGVTKAASALRYACSGYFKAAELTSVLFYFTNGNASKFSEVTVNLSTGVITGTTTSGFASPVFTVRDAGNGWWRIIIVATTDTDTAMTWQIWPGPVSGTTTGTGTDGIYVWGAQIDPVAGESALVETTTTAGLTSWKEMFLGRIDDIAWENDPLSITCTDLGGFLVDTQVEFEGLQYGTSPVGTAMETVVQNIVNNWHSGKLTTGQETLSVPVSPGFPITSYRLGRVKVMEAIRTVALSIGWDLRFRYDAADTLRLTLLDPQRSRSTIDDTIGPSEYNDVTRMAISLANIRNVGRVYYRDFTTGAIANVTATDSGSVTKYGRRYFELQSSENIRSSTDATTLINAVVNDLSASDLDHVVDMLFYWPVQLYDRYTLTQNGDHYDTDQVLTVVGYRHSFDNGTAKTSISFAGKVVGAYRDWIKQITPALASNPLIMSVVIAYPDLSNIEITATGDVVTRSWRFAASTASMPTLATVRAATSIDGQTVKQTLAVAVAAGVRLFVAALAYSQTGATGTESALFTIDTIRSGTGLSPNPYASIDVTTESDTQVIVNLNGGPGVGSSATYTWQTRVGVGSYSLPASSLTLPQPMTINRNPKQSKKLDLLITFSDGTTAYASYNVVGQLPFVDFSAGTADLGNSSIVGKHLGNITDDPTSDRRAATAVQKAGGDRGWTGFDVNGDLSRDIITTRQFAGTGRGVADHISYLHTGRGSAQNLILNGDFEIPPSASGADGIAGDWGPAETHGTWTAVRELNGASYSGSNVALIRAPSAVPFTDFCAVQTRSRYNIAPGGTYTLSAYINTQQNVSFPAGQSAYANVFLRVAYSDSSVIDYVGGTVYGINNVWQLVSGTFTVPVPSGKTITYGVVYIEAVATGPTGTPGAGQVYDARYDQVSLVRVTSIDTEVQDGATYRRPLINEATGGGYGYTGLDSSGQQTVGVRPNAKIADQSAVVIARRAGNYFTEAFDVAPNGNGWTCSGVVPSLVTGNSTVQVGSNIILWNGGYGAMTGTKLLPFNPNKLYRIRCRFITQTLNTSGSSVWYIGLQQFDYNGAVVLNSNAGVAYICASGATPPVATWVEYVGWFKGASLALSTYPSVPSTDPRSPAILSLGTTSIIPLIYAGYSGTGGQFYMDYFVIDEFDEDGSARTYNALGTDFNLTSGVLAKNGSVPRAITSGRIRQTGYLNTGSFSWSGTVPSTPLISLTGGVSYEPRSVWGTKPQADTNEGAGHGTLAPLAASQVDDIAPYNTSLSGFSVRALIRQSGGALTSHAGDTFSPTSATAVGTGLVVTTASAPAYNDTYSISYSYDFEKGGVAVHAVSFTVVVSLDYYNGSSWVSSSTTTYAGSDPGTFGGGSGNATAIGGDALTATVSGRVATSQFRLIIQSASATGTGVFSLSISSPVMTYSTAAADQYASKTPPGISATIDVTGAS